MTSKTVTDRPTTAAEKIDGLTPLTYTAAQLAEVLNVSERHVWRMADAGELPAPIRIGRRVLWPRKAIDLWLAARTEGR